ncbi:MAG TPA: hypothetical protein VGQ55_05205 [Pyrinomonadaceae bacterium]|nr:hypothetical protein [Pyrinomonadaceae bacterium]
MNKFLNISIGVIFIGIIAFFGVAALSHAQELPGGMTKEEFCAMRASGTMPTRPEGAPPQGAGFPGGGMLPAGGMPPQGMQRPAGRTMPEINCDDIGTSVAPSATSSVPIKPVIPVASKIPASATTTYYPRVGPATQKSIQTQAESYEEDTSGNPFFGSGSTFSGRDEDINIDDGFFAFVVAKVSSVFKGLFSWF